MKKKILIILILFLICLTNIKAVDKEMKVYDYNQSITLNQENELRKNVLDYIKKSNIDMVLITVKHYETKTVEEYAKEFYDKNQFGIDNSGSTIMYILDYTDEPILEIFTIGKASNIYSEITKEELKETINLNDSSYKIFNTLINKSKKYTKNYKDVSKYVVFNKISGNDYIIICIISFLITTSIMILLILKSRIRKLKKENYEKINVRMIKSVDKFLNTHTEAYRYGNKK